MKKIEKLELKGNKEIFVKMKLSFKYSQRYIEELNQKYQIEEEHSEETKVKYWTLIVQKIRELLNEIGINWDESNLRKIFPPEDYEILGNQIEGASNRKKLWERVFIDKMKEQTNKNIIQKLKELLKFIIEIYEKVNKREDQIVFNKFIKNEIKEPIIKEIERLNFDWFDGKEDEIMGIIEKEFASEIFKEGLKMAITIYNHRITIERERKVINEQELTIEEKSKSKEEELNNKEEEIIIITTEKDKIQEFDQGNPNEKKKQKLIEFEEKDDEELIESQPLTKRKGKEKIDIDKEIDWAKGIEDVRLAQLKEKERKEKEKKRKRKEKKRKEKKRKEKKRKRKRKRKEKKKKRKEEREKELTKRFGIGMKFNKPNKALLPIIIQTKKIEEKLKSKSEEREEELTKQILETNLQPRKAKIRANEFIKKSAKKMIDEIKIFQDDNIIILSKEDKRKRENQIEIISNEEIQEKEIWNKLQLIFIDVLKMKEEMEKDDEILMIGNLEQRIIKIR